MYHSGICGVKVFVYRFLDTKTMDVRFNKYSEL